MNVLLENEHIVIVSQPVGPFAMNQLLVGCKRTHNAALIDAGAAPDDFIRAAADHGLTITHLLQTHAHIDHVAGLPETKKALPLPLHLHKEDLPVYQQVPLQAKMLPHLGLSIGALPDIDHFYTDGETISVGELSFEILHTPGHSPGHVCLYAKEARVLIGGDLLFRQSIGRTDLPLCDPQKMMHSLRRVMELPDDVMVFPGHMEPTTIGFERRMNPFLQNL